MFDRTLETMTQTLRGQQAPPTFVPSLPGSRPLLPRLMRPGLAMAVAFGIGAVALLSLPRPAIAHGWQDARTATQRAAYRHTRMFEDDRLFLEGWSGPNGSAMVGYAEPRNVTSERRYNAKRSYDFFDFLHYRGTQNAPPNARASGEVVTLVSAPRVTNLIDESIQNVLRSGEAKRSEPQLDGDGVWYDVTTTIKIGPRTHTADYQVRVGPDGRLGEERLRGSRLRTLYDYPEAIPAAVFEPQPQVRKVPVIDRDVVRREMVAQIRRGSEARFGVRLRLAVMDQEGKLFVFWTGPAVGAGTTGDVRLPGVRTDPATGLASDLAWYRSPAQRGIAKVIGKPLPGRAIIPRQKIGARVTIAIPGQGGEAVFRDVPILRLNNLRYERELLGYGRPRTKVAE